MVDKNRLNSIANNIQKQVDIVQIVGNYIDLHRKGKDFWGLCPFHDDHNASLCVSQEKQIWTCFSCHKTGNVFKFVEEFEHISFVPALKRVCELARINVPSELNFNMPVIENKHQRLYDLMADLAKFYTLQLQTEEGKEAQEYVNKRNLNNNDIVTFKIGFAPADGVKQITYLHNKGYSDDEIISTGIGVSNSNGQVSDLFKGRVTFALLDTKGRVVGFSGRRLNNDENTAKYKNSSESVIFNKSNTLYNYKNAFDNASNGYTYIVEGFMDAIAMHKAGYKSVVATMGTAFTNDHIKLLKNLKSEIILLFDADESGQTATKRCLEKLRNQNIKLQVVKPFTQHKDADEVLNIEGKDKLDVLLKDLISPLEWYLDNLSKTTNFNNHEDVKRFVDESINIMSLYKLDEIDKEFYFNNISNKAKVSVPVLRRMYDAKAEQNNDDYINSLYDEDHSYNEVVKRLNKYEQASHQILLMMIDNPVNVIKYNEMGIALCDKSCRQVAALILSLFNKGLDITYSNLMNDAPNELQNFIGQLAREEYPESKLEDLFNILSVDYNDKLTIDQLNEELLSETDLKKQQEIALKIINLKRNKNGRN